jgi:hypothetical protein
MLKLSSSTSMSLSSLKLWDYKLEVRRRLNSLAGDWNDRLNSLAGDWNDQVESSSGSPTFIWADWFQIYRLSLDRKLLGIAI